MTFLRRVYAWCGSATTEKVPNRVAIWFATDVLYDCLRMYDSVRRIVQLVGQKQDFRKRVDGGVRCTALRSGI